MTALARYDAARAALAECRRVDEAKDIRDRAEAMRVYARQARDVQLEIDAWEIRIRAERRLGEMIAEQKATVGLNRGGRPAKTGSDSEPVLVPTLADAGIDKKLSSAAQKVASISEQAFEAMVARRRSEMEGARFRRDLGLVSIRDKAEHRAARERELGDRQRALPAKKYGVILADPEWRFEPRSRETGMDRAADNHYPTSSTDEICARPVAAIAADDAVLFLWATVPMLPDALRVMAAWGFTYKSHVIWFKDRIGTGYWFRNAHELLLVGTRGALPAPTPGAQFSSVIEAPVAEHSRKPDDFFDLIESYFPNLPRIELNARRSRDGWDAWGNEAPQQKCPGSPAAEMGTSADRYESSWSRPVTGRTVTATSERMDVTAGETAPHTSDEAFDPETGEIHAPANDGLDIPEFLRRTA